MRTKLAPSILSADFARLGEEVRNLAKAGADYIHFDCMDNHYVPNLSIGPMVLKALKPYAEGVPIDAHIMASPVDALIKSFAEAGADVITFHPEASAHINRSLALCASLGVKKGLALNPGTPIGFATESLDDLDCIMVMSVNPGFGGQKFIPRSLEKLRACKAAVEERNKRRAEMGMEPLRIELEVDGGVNESNCAACVEAGATVLVAGSAILGQADEADHRGPYVEVFGRFRAALASAERALP